MFPSLLPDALPATRRDLGWRLFFLGFVALFLALAVTRYLGGSVWVPGFFPNLVLVAALAGAGTGCLLHRHVSERSSSTVFAGSSLGLLLLVVLAKFSAPAPEIESHFVFFAALFLATALTFFCVAQRAAKIFAKLAPLTGCSIGISGAIAGSLAFMLVGRLESPPWVWFLLLVPIFPLVIGRHARLPQLAAPVVLLCASGLSWDQDLLLTQDPAADGQLEVRWSRYKKIEHFQTPNDPSPLILVNGVASHEMLPSKDLARSCPSAVHGERSVAGQAPYSNVLVLDAGVGNDVASALAGGAKHVDAVEVDPVIVELSRRHHPLQPYRDPRVTLTRSDARAFLRRATRRYDLIVIASTGAPAAVHPLPELRRRDIAYGMELVLGAGGRLTDAGDIFVCGPPSAVEKYQQTFPRAAGKARTIFKRADIEGLLVSNAATSAPAGFADADLWTGRDHVGSASCVGPLLVGSGAMVLLVLVLGRRNRGRVKLLGAQGGISARLAFASAGLVFLVLVSRSSGRLASVFDGTWTSAFLIFVAVSAGVLAGHRLAGLASGLPLWLICCLVPGSFLLAVSDLPFKLLSIDSSLLRSSFFGLVVLGPIVFACLFFGTALRDKHSPEGLVGAGLLGAGVGGLLECSGLGAGRWTAAIIVAIGYGAALALLTRARRRGRASSSTPVQGTPDGEQAGPGDAEAAGASWAIDRPRRLAVILFLGLLAVYHSNGDFLPAGDAMPSGYLASSLFEEGNLSLTPKEVPFMFREWGRPTTHRLRSTEKDGDPLSEYQERYYLVPTVHKGVFVSTFGPGPTIAALPVFAFLRLTHGNLAGRPAVLWYGGKSAASLFVAGSAVFVFLAALLFVRTRQALLIAAAYGLGTCVFCISSQALWQHGPNEFFLAMGSYFFLRHQGKGLYAALSGLAFGCAVCCRPSSAVVVLIIGVFLLIANRRALVRFVAGGFLPALLLICWNVYYFGSALQTGQGIRGPSVALAKTGLAAVWQTPLWKGLLGLMVSPSRGLLVFSPFMAFALWGAIRVWRQGEKAAGLQVLSLCVASLLLMQFKWFDWWGGHTYGYRPIVDAMPMLALFLVVLVDPIWRRPVLRGLFGVLLAWAIVVQVIGAFAYNERDWNTQRTEVRPMAKADSLTLSYGVPYTSRAANIDDAAFRYRLWSIRDSTILHHLRFFRAARRLKKAVMVVRLASVAMPAFGAMLQTACSPPLARPGVDGVIDVGTEQAHEFLRHGWNAGDERVDGRTVRWALGGTARVEVSLAPWLVDRQLTITAKPAMGRRPQRIVVDVNGQYVGQVTMAPAWKTYRFLVPKGVLRSGVNQIDLKHDWCIQPSADDPTSRDERHLAALYDEIALIALTRLPDELESTFGTTGERERLALCGGFDDQEESSERTFVRAPGPSPSFTFTLGIESKHYLLVVEARADGAGHESSALNISVNGKVIGKIAIDQSWVRRALALPADLLQNGVNTIKLIPTSLGQPDTLLSKLMLRPLHSRHQIDLGTAPARRNLGPGWSVDEVEKNRSVVWSDGATSHIDVELHLGAPRYAMKVTARAYEAAAPLAVAFSCNGHFLGELSWTADWREQTLSIPRHFLREGLNALELSYSKTVRPSVLNPLWDDNRSLAIVVDSLSVSPVAERGSGR